MADEKKLSTNSTDPKDINQPDPQPRPAPAPSPEKIEETPLPKSLGSVTEKQKLKENLGFKIKPDEQAQEEAGESPDGETGQEQTPETAPEDGAGQAAPEEEGSKQPQPGDKAEDQPAPKTAPEQKAPSHDNGEQAQSPQQRENQSQSGNEQDDKNKKKKDDEEEEKKKKDDEEEKKKKEEEEEKKKKEEEEKKPEEEKEKAPGEEEPESGAKEEPAGESSEPEGTGEGPESAEPDGAAEAEGAEAAEGGEATEAGTAGAEAGAAGEESAGAGAGKAAKGLKAVEAKTQAIRKAIIKFLSSWQAIAVVFGIFLLLGLITWIIGIFMPRTHTDTQNPADQAAITEVVSLAESNKITFIQPDDLNKIKKGEIGKPSLQMMSYLANRHETIEINYNNQNYSGDNSSSSNGTLPAGENEPYEFDIVSVDSIKCVNADSKEKLPTIPINLSSTFNWSSLIRSDYNDKIKCAVSYYPGETPATSDYSSLGPGEFSILDIATAGPKAAKQKMAEITSEMLKIDSEIPATERDDSLVPLKITLDSGYALDAGNNAGIVEVLQNEIKAAYPSATSKDEGVVSSNLPYGIHVNYL